MSFIPGNSGSAASAPDGVRGLTAGVAASAGIVGEEISNSTLRGSALTITTNTDKTVATIILTAGDWDVSATAGWVAATSWTSTQQVTGIILSTSTLSGLSGNAYAVPDASGQIALVGLTNIGNQDFMIAFQSYRISLTVTTTYILQTRLTFSAGTGSSYGFLRARRMR